MLEKAMVTLAELKSENHRRLKLQVLETERHFLCQNLNPSSHFPFFRSAGVLTRDEQEQISNVRRQESTSASAGKLLDVLATKQQGFDELCNALRVERTQMFLLERLNMCLEILINQQKAVNGNTMSWEVSPADIESRLPGPPEESGSKLEVLPSISQQKEDREQSHGFLQDSAVHSSTGAHESSRGNGTRNYRNSSTDA
jgi:hypothetical protein